MPIRSLRILLILMVGMAYGVVCGAQNNVVLNLSDTIPIDPSVRAGKLANGFTYFIKKNDKPKRKVRMALTVKAGSVLEEDDQTELAHFLEHMALNGTIHFATAFEFMDNAGIRFGMEANAFTGYDDTHYFIEIPSANRKLVNDGILLLSDFAQGILLEKEAIDAERGVLLNEIRNGRGYSQRMRDVYFPQLIRGSRYAEQTKTSDQRSRNIEVFNYESLQKFYHDWYRPELQCAIVVGDVNVDSVENSIKVFFGKLVNPDPRRERSSFVFSPDGSNKIIRVADEEMPHTEVTFYMKRKENPCITYGDFRTSVISKLYDRMARLRFAAVNRNYNLPFRRASHLMSEQGLPRMDVLETHFEVDSGCIGIGIKAVLAEIFRIKRFGFTEDEWRQARESIDKEYLAAREFDSRDLAARLNDYYLENKSAPDPAWERLLVRYFLNELTLQDVNMQAKQWIDDINLDIVILTPVSEQLSVPRDFQIEEMIGIVKASSLTPYSPKTAKKPLVNKRALRQISRHKFKTSYIDGVGAVELALDNGIQVVLKSTVLDSSRGDNIVLHGFGGGGAHLYNAAEYESVAAAAEIVSHSGIADFNQFELQDFLAGKAVLVSPYIYHNEVGIRGSCKLQDIETLMRLVYLYYTMPRVSEDAFKDWKSNERAAIRRIGRSPEGFFNSEISSVLCSYGVRRGQKTLSGLEQVSFRDIERLYKDCFAKAEHFKFVVTGPFDVDMMTALAASYLGSLPYKAVDRKYNSEPLDKCKYIPGATKVVRAGVDSDKANVKLYFLGNYDYSIKNCLDLDALGYVLRSVLTNRLREKESGTYGVNLGVTYSKSNQNKFVCVISFSCNADHVDRLVGAALDEIEVLKSGTGDIRTIKNFISTEQASMQSIDSNTDFWKYYLVRQYKEGRDLNEVFKRRHLLPDVTEEEIRSLARKILIEGNLSKFILLPADTLRSN